MKSQWILKKVTSADVARLARAMMTGRRRIIGSIVASLLRLNRQFAVETQPSQMGIAPPLVVRNPARISKGWIP